MVPKKQSGLNILPSHTHPFIPLHQATAPFSLLSRGDNFFSRFQYRPACCTFPRIVPFDGYPYHFKQLRHDEKSNVWFNDLRSHDDGL